MKRTQIYLDSSLAEDLRIGARINGISTSEYIRKLLKEALGEPAGGVRRIKKKPLSTLADIAVPFGIKDLARNFDKYFEESLT